MAVLRPAGELIARRVEGKGAAHRPDAVVRGRIRRMSGSAPDRAESPRWDKLAIEVRCPRCDYDLRLLPQPRCPECGLQFKWAEVIAAAQKRLECPLFEYRWRDRPIRSFFITISLATLPWRLWRRTPLTAAPRVGPLLARICQMMSIV
jgi:hypothetical protein